MYVRITDLERFFTYRYGAQLPDNASGRDALFVLANHLAHRDNPENRILAAARRWAPWHDDDETDEMIGQIIPRPLTWKADKLAERLGLDYATRTRLGITTIGATDFPKAMRTRRRKRLSKERKRAKRAQAGAAPHATSAARTQPRIALGMSERTYYRKRKNGTTGSNSVPPYPTDIR